MTGTTTLTNGLAPSASRGKAESHGLRRNPDWLRTTRRLLLWGIRREGSRQPRTSRLPRPVRDCLLLFACWRQLPQRPQSWLRLPGSSSIGFRSIQFIHQRNSVGHSGSQFMSEIPSRYFTTHAGHCREPQSAHACRSSPWRNSSSQRGRKRDCILQTLSQRQLRFSQISSDDHVQGNVRQILPVGGGVS